MVLNNSHKYITSTNLTGTRPVRFTVFKLNGGNMKMLKSELAGDLMVLGKCGDLVRIEGKSLSATNGTEMGALEIHPLDEAPLEAVVSLFALRQAVGGGKSGGSASRSMPKRGRCLNKCRKHSNR